jgi:hypothetical protein
VYTKPSLPANLLPGSAVAMELELQAARACADAALEADRGSSAGVGAGNTAAVRASQHGLPPDVSRARGCSAAGILNAEPSSARDVRPHVLYIPDAAAEAMWPSGRS